MAKKKRKLDCPSSFTPLRPSRSCGGRRCPRTWWSGRPSWAYDALALVDRDGLSGAPRFFKAARARGIRPIVGAELSLDGGGALPLLVETQQGYRSLCRLITRMKAGVAEGRGAAALRDAGRDGRGALRPAGGRDAAAVGKRPLDTDRLARVVEAFGPGRVFLDVQRHRRREQEAANQALLDLADALGLRAVATNGVRHATSPRRALLDVLTCIREKRTLASAGRLLAQNAERHLKPPKAMAALFADRQDLLRNAEALAERLAFTLDDLGYRVPRLPGAAGRDAVLVPAPDDRGGCARALPAVPREGAARRSSASWRSSASSTSPATS